MAIFYTLTTFAPCLKNEVVHFRCDNMTALYCIRSFGSRDGFCDRLTVRIFELVEKHNIELKISYVKSANNVSDKASRQFKGKSIHTEWSLSMSDFTTSMKHAHVTPEVDLFASDQNKKLPKFCSWGPSHQAMQVDCFVLDWCDIKGFLFPPFSLICSTLKKCVDDRIQHMCGIFPWWPTKSWWSTLMKLSRNQFVPLPRAGHRLSLPWDQEQKHPMSKRLKLIFMILSMNYYFEEKFPKNSLNSLPIMPGGKQWSKTKRVLSRDGYNSPKLKKFKNMI